MALNISLATEADLKSLTSIIMKARDTNLLRGLIYMRGKPENAETEEGLIYLDLLNITGDSKSRIFKAALRSGSRIVGFGSIQFQYGEVAEYSPPDYVPPGMNNELSALCSQESVAMHRKHLNGQKHVVWQALYVHPVFQGQGIASELLTWGFEHFGLARETIWVQTPMSGRPKFLRYGWEDVDCVDLDLSKWAGEHMGYGLYRMQMMIRKPGRLDRDRKDVNEKRS